MSENEFKLKYLETKHAWDNVNQTLKSIIKNEEEVSKEEIIRLLKECTEYFHQKVTFCDIEMNEPMRDSLKEKEYLPYVIRTNMRFWDGEKLISSSQLAKHFATSKEAEQEADFLNKNRQELLNKNDLFFYVTFW